MKKSKQIVKAAKSTDKSCMEYIEQYSSYTDTLH